jgi:DNA-binding transcriptional LysR family regulator
VLLLIFLYFAIVEGPFYKSKFRYEKFKDDELVLAVSPENELAKQKKVDAGDIIKGNLILREKGSGTRKIFEDRLLKEGYDLNYLEGYMEIGSISAIKSLVETNLGYTVISRETIKKELNLGTIKVAAIKNMRIFREFNFVWLPDNEEEFINKFIEFCLENSNI